MYSKDLTMSNKNICGINLHLTSEQVWPRGRAINCAKSGFPSSRVSAVQRARHCWGLIREQNDHLFLQSDEETLTCLIGAFVWGLFLGWLPDCSPGERWLEQGNAVVLMITLDNYTGVVARWQWDSNEMSGLKCGHRNPQLLFYVFHTYPLTDQSYHTHKQAPLIVSKQITTSAFGINAYKYTRKHLGVDTYKQKQPCVHSHTQSDILNTHILDAHTQAHARPCTYTRARTHCLFVASASFLSLHADCVSGTGVKVWSHTQAVCSVWLLHTLNGLYEWLGLNDWVNTRGHTQPNPTTGFGDKSETTFSQRSQEACLN